MTLRVAFLGNDVWSVPSLDAIAAEPELSLVQVVTNPPKEAGRGSTLTQTPVAVAASEHGAPLLEAPGVLDGPGARALAVRTDDHLAANTLRGLAGIADALAASGGRRPLRRATAYRDRI